MQKARRTGSTLAGPLLVAVPLLAGCGHQATDPALLHRLERLEAEVVALRADVSGVRPALDRLVRAEPDIVRLVAALPPKPATRPAALPPPPTGSSAGSAAIPVAATLKPPTQSLPAPVPAPPAPLPVPLSAPLPAPLPPPLPGLETEAFGVHLASYRSLPSVIAGWQAFRKRHGGALADRTARVATVDFQDGRGPFLRLKAGPFPDAESARTACAAIAGRSGYCEVTDFEGDPLVKQSAAAR